MSNPPLVSIIIPTFNRVQFIGEALDSILFQTYAHWECIVVDDGSTDDTFEILAAYCLKDERFQYFKRPAHWTKGANGSRNYGISKSKGLYLAFCDDDDFWLKFKLEKQMEVFQNHPNVDLVTGNIEYVKIDGLRTGRVIEQDKNHNFLFEDFLYKNRMSMITPVFKREVYDNVGEFNTDFAIYEDWEYWRRVAYKHRIYAIPDVLACVRKHDTNTSLIVTHDPYDEYVRYHKLNLALLKWGEDRFSKSDKKLIEKITWQRYKRLLRNHCHGLKNKILFLRAIFDHSFKEGINFIELFLKFGL